MSSSHHLIHVSSSDFRGNEQLYVSDCLSRGHVSQGYYVSKFEEMFAERHNVRYAITCSSGTAALHLAMLAIGIGSDSCVVVPAITYIATANAARYCRARVVFCDVDPDSWCVNWIDDSIDQTEHIHENESAYTFVGVDLYDSRSDILVSSGMSGIARRIICDACHSTGQPHNPDVLTSIYSFYGSKIISCGEGGMVATNDEEIANLVRLCRGQGATESGTYYHHVTGYNYRMTDIQAAIGLAQLERLDEMLDRRRQIIDRYRSNLMPDSRITLQGGRRSSGWMMAVLMPEGADVPSIRDRMLSNGIETRPFFVPLHTLPVYSTGNPSNVSLPIAESIARRGICLPTHTQLTDQDIDYVCESLQEAIQ